MQSQNPSVPVWVCVLLCVSGPVLLALMLIVVLLRIVVPVNVSLPIGVFAMWGLVKAFPRGSEDRPQLRLDSKPGPSTLHSPDHHVPGPD